MIRAASMASVSALCVALFGCARSGALAPSTSPPASITFENMRILYLGDVPGVDDDSASQLDSWEVLASKIVILPKQKRVLLSGLEIAHGDNKGDSTADAEVRDDSVKDQMFYADMLLIEPRRGISFRAQHLTVLPAKHFVLVQGVTPRENPMLERDPDAKMRTDTLKRKVEGLESELELVRQNRDQALKELLSGLLKDRTVSPDALDAELRTLETEHDKILSAVATVKDVEAAKVKAHGDLEVATNKLVTATKEAGDAQKKVTKLQRDVRVLTEQLAIVNTLNANYKELIEKMGGDVGALAKDVETLISPWKTEYKKQLDEAIGQRNRTWQAHEAMRHMLSKCMERFPEAE